MAHRFWRKNKNTYTGRTRVKPRHAFVAQGIEHRSPKAGVAGSNPAGGTDKGSGRTDEGLQPARFRFEAVGKWTVAAVIRRAESRSAPSQGTVKKV